MVKEAIELYIESLKEHNEEIPTEEENLIDVPHLRQNIPLQLLCFLRISRDRQESTLMLLRFNVFKIAQSLMFCFFGNDFTGHMNLL